MTKITGRTLWYEDIGKTSGIKTYVRSGDTTKTVTELETQKYLVELTQPVTGICAVTG